MHSFKRITTLNEMNNEERKEFIELIYKNCRKDDINKFLQANKDNIKSNLSGSAKRMFEDDVLKHKNLHLEFFNQIISKLDDVSQAKFIDKMIKSLCRDDKELGEWIIKQEELEDEDMLLDHLYLVDDDKIKGYFSLFRLLHMDIGISEEEVINTKATETIKKEFKSRDERITELEDENRALKEKEKENKKAHKKEIDELNKTHKKEIDELNKTYEKDISELRERLEEAIINPSSTPSSIQSNIPSSSDDEGIKDNKPSIEEDNNASSTNNDQLFDHQSVINDLANRTLIGVVKAEGIQIDKNWIIVTPIIPILGDNEKIDRDDFLKHVDYRGEYSTCILYLSSDVLRMVLKSDDADYYQYMNADEKYKCLYNAFCKKLLFYVPYFYETDDKYKLNAILLCKPVEYRDFSNSSFVPFYDAPKKEFEAKLSRYEDLVVDNYPSTLSSSLRYIFVKDAIYEINYIPKGRSVNGKYNVWKPNPKRGHEPFRKLDLKIDTDSSDRYIYTPNIDKRTNDLYVKNIMFIQSSGKKDVAFDEEEFISNVYENAKSRNLYYTEDDLRQFHIAVKSSSLVILAGLSGIGKTKLPMVYANTLGLNEARNTLLFVPISPSFLEPEDVLGYIKPLNNDDENNAEYIESQTGLVSFLIDANEHKDKIHIVVFDEMNLSQIEYWFAPFISLLEQDSDSRTLKLYSSTLKVKNSERYPSSINIGENVIFIGTVNIDETTKQISDRLLDRAIVINLASPSFSKLKDMGSATSEIYPEVSYSRFMAAVNKVDNPANAFSDMQFALIDDVNNLLINSSYGKGISFRSLNKMALCIKNAKNILSDNDAIDFVLSQIVIKKIKGSKEELDDIFSDDDSRGLLSVLNAHNEVSEFKKSRQLIELKSSEINKYGFTR